MNRGYVKVWRKIEDSGIMGNADLCQMLMYLMLKATHKTIKVAVGAQIVTLRPGQFFAGRRQLASALNSTEQKVRTCLKSLEKCGIINQQSTSKGSIISLINWDKYQSEQPAANQQLTSTQPAVNQHATNEQPAANQQLTTKQECKNINTEKKKKTLTATHPEYAEYATSFQNRVADLQGNIAPAITQGLINQAVDVIDKLVRVDGFTLPEIQATMDWAAGSDFWGKNAMSLAAVRKPLRNGTMKFKQIVADMQRQGLPRIGQQSDQFAGVI